MKPHEIEMVEELQRLGDGPSEWLPLGEMIPGVGRKSSNDMLWHGYEFEAKRVEHTKYKAVRGHIAPVVESARKTGVLKDRFLIDIGYDDLTSVLKEELSHYNQDRSKYAIRELWVMFGDGTDITRINLL